MSLGFWPLPGTEDILAAVCLPVSYPSAAQLSLAPRTCVQSHAAVGLLEDGSQKTSCLSICSSNCACIVLSLYMKTRLRMHMYVFRSTLAGVQAPFLHFGQMLMRQSQLFDCSRCDAAVVLLVSARVQQHLILNTLLTHPCMQAWDPSWQDDRELAWRNLKAFVDQTGDARTPDSGS